MVVSSHPFTVGVVAGEASGDLLGAHLLAALKRRYPNLQVIGIAGPKMQAQGARSLFPMETLAVRGYVEVLRRYRKIVGIRQDLKRYFRASPPDLFIGIDAPDFNLDLERHLREAGIPTLHYVSPSIWAWRRERMATIKAAVDHVLCLFPFEKPLYDAAGVPATYVGHPLADLLPLQPDREAARARLKLSNAPVLAFLPGSRQSELQYLAATFVQAARLVATAMPEVQILVPLATRETKLIFQEALARWGGEGLPLTVLNGHAHEAMTAADAVLVASGTATLEAALLKRPMVIAYKMPWLTYQISKRKAYLPWVGLPNILAGRFVVPELLQDAATPEALAEALLGWLRHPEKVAEAAAEFARQHDLLRQDTADKAAEVIAAMLERRA